MILITGATGHIGNVLVRQLASRYPQEKLRLFLQPGEQLDAFSGLTVELFYGDIRSAEDVSFTWPALLTRHRAGPSCCMK